MRVLLINPPYQTLTSNCGVGHQIPLGLLMVGGPLLDAGHEVRLLDAECRRLNPAAVVAAVRRFGPGRGHDRPRRLDPRPPGLHPTMLRAIKAAFPEVVTVYGGVYPTYHARRSWLGNRRRLHRPGRGRGHDASSWSPSWRRGTAGLSAAHRSPASPAWRSATGATSFSRPIAPPIPDLDACRVGWELIEDWSAYQCFGLGRAAIVQFSRGCPHRCTYCGQHGFWVRWRHRDPVKLADEVEWLYRTHDVRFITLADENPTTSRDDWQAFLEELASRRLPVRFFATIRATDIVRDADLLPLYREAGILYVLMGIESTDAGVLREDPQGLDASRRTSRPAGC